MSVHLKSIEGIGDLAAMMRDMGAKARVAARRLALATPAEKSRALRGMAQVLRGSTTAVLAANAEDLAEARKAGATVAFLDRLALDERRIAAVATGLEVIADLADPVGTVMASWERPNGMKIERVRVPL